MCNGLNINQTHRLNFVDDHDIDLLHLGKATPGKSAYTAMSEEPVLEAVCGDMQ
jgi:hypothetical protein